MIKLNQISMKAVLVILIAAVGMVFWGPAAVKAAWSGDQEKEEEVKTREEVTVTNVEVPVRVFYKGEAVKNLTRKDFRLYEDNDLQAVNGFFPKNKKISIQDIKLATSERDTAPPAARFFVLVFRITYYNDEIKAGVDFLFENVLRDEDQVMIFANDKTLFLTRDYKRVKRQKLLDQVLREESIKANQRLLGYFTRIQRALNVTKTELKLRDIGDRQTGISTRPDQLVNFLRKYLDSWIEYKKKYLLPDVDKYYNFANFLEKLDKEKWVINFYQIEMFPKLKYTGELRQQIEDIMSELLAGRSEDIVYSRTMLALLSEIDKELNVAKDYQADELSKLFYKVNATCHSLFCGLQKESLSQDLEFRRISTDIENSLREITSRTGGALVVSNDLESALHTISEKEDFYYLLTYYPKNPGRIGKLKVETTNPAYRVMYDDRMRADYIKEYIEKRNALMPSIVIDNVFFKDKQLHIEISHFMFQDVGEKEKRTANIGVRIRINDDNEQSFFDKSRLLAPEKKVTTITINFDWLKKGEYNIIIDANDFLTGKTAMEFLQTTIE